MVHALFRLPIYIHLFICIIVSTMTIKFLTLWMKQSQGLERVGNLSGVTLLIV